MKELGVIKKRKVQQMKWVDSMFRFFATVSPIQDNPPHVRMELCVPSTHEDYTDSLLHDNLFIPLQEVIFLRPYQPRNAMLLVNPTLYEVVVRVENFWSKCESGGNSGRVIRRGTVYVTGETDALRRLCGEKDTRFTRPQYGCQNGDGSGVRGLEHTLKGGIKIRRFRKRELSSMNTFHQKWVCIDYSTNHPFHCKHIPVCTNRSGRQAAIINPECLHRDELFLERQSTNPVDDNAITIVSRPGGDVVGFVPRDIAGCLAPCLDAGVVTSHDKGVYSEVDVGGDTHHRVWFRIDTGIPGPGNAEESILQQSLIAIPWWVSNDADNE
jgi:hypothetical protein